MIDFARLLEKSLAAVKKREEPRGEAQGGASARLREPSSPRGLTRCPTAITSPSPGSASRILGASSTRSSASLKAALARYYESVAD